MEVVVVGAGMGRGGGGGEIKEQVDAVTDIP